MKTRNELIQYFTEKYKDNTFYKPNFEEKSNDELIQAYEHDMYVKKEKENILNNGLITYRISYETEEAGKEIASYMRKNKMYTYDEEGLSFSLRIGNYCIVHIPSYFVDKLKEKFGNKISHIDLKTKWLGQKDIQGLKVGDKVSLTVSGVFGNSNDQGTVYSINENSITIRRYRSRTKGYVLSVGEQGSVEKINSFMKVS